jgi:hypothetical protein
MNAYQSNMTTMIDDFYLNYADLIDLAKHHMGDLFNPYDYPSIEELRSKFGFRLVFSPLPEGGDFRLDIPKADMDELGEQYESAFKDRLKDAMREPWEKLHKSLTHISEKLTEEDGDDVDEVEVDDVDVEVVVKFDVVVDDVVDGFFLGIHLQPGYNVLILLEI